MRSLPKEKATSSTLITSPLCMRTLSRNFNSNVLKSIRLTLWASMGFMPIVPIQSRSRRDSRKREKVLWPTLETSRSGSRVLEVATFCTAIVIEGRESDCAMAKQGATKVEAPPISTFRRCINIIWSLRLSERVNNASDLLNNWTGTKAGGRTLLIAS